MEPFTFPKLFWIFPVPILLWAFCRFLLRKGGIGVALFLFVAAVSWYIYDSLFGYSMEKWMRQQRVFEIIFHHFPEDKDEYIHQYVVGYKSGGQIGLARKQEAAKIYMILNHLKYYIVNTPAQDISQFVAAETALLGALYQKDQEACFRYVNDSMNYAEAWHLVGSDIFLAAVHNVPQMIVDAIDHPEPVSESDRFRAAQVYSNIWNEMQTLGLDARTMSLHRKKLTCGIYYREFLMLSQLPPKDAALFIKLLLSKDNFSNYSIPALTSQKLIPFH
jgi:hypothetical protein